MDEPQLPRAQLHEERDSLREGYQLPAVSVGSSNNTVPLFGPDVPFVHIPSCAWRRVAEARFCVPRAQGSEWEGYSEMPRF